jgi:hypothetical protein
MPITPLTSSDTFKTWFDTTNTIITTVNGITGVGGTGISGPYVVSFNGSTGVITFSNYVSMFNGLTGSVSGVTGVVGGLGISISGTATNPTITNTGVLSVNGYTNTPTGFAELSSSQIFTALQQFTGGISASGATFSGNISAPNVLTTSSANTFTALQTFSGGITASGATFNGNVVFNKNITAPNVVNSFNGLTGAVTGVNSFNGLTGAVTGVTTSTVNNFTALQTFSAGITATTLWVSTQCDIAAPTFTVRSPNTLITSGNNVTNIVTLPSGQVIRTQSTNTTSTTPVSIFEYLLTEYSSAEFLIQAERYTSSSGTLGMQTVKILMSGTCANSTYSVSHVEYGNITNGSSVATYTVDTNGSSWRLRVTPSSSNTTRIRTVAILDPNTGGVGSGA